jgi:hypothetical protein
MSGAGEEVERKVLRDEMTEGERHAYRRGMVAGVLFAAREMTAVNVRDLTPEKRERILGRIRWLLDRLTTDDTPLNFPEDLDRALPPLQ